MPSQRSPSAEMRVTHEHNKAQACEHREELERVSAQAQAQREELERVSAHAQAQSEEMALVSLHVQMQREEIERMAAQTLKLTQRVELTECILTDTLQAIDDGEADLQALKMYLRTALASLKREDVAQISFGK